MWKDEYAKEYSENEKELMHQLRTYTGEEFSDFFDNNIRVTSLEYKGRTIGIRLGKTYGKYGFRVYVDISIGALNRYNINPSMFKILKEEQMSEVKGLLVSDFEVKNSVIVECVDCHVAILGRLQRYATTRIKNQPIIEKYLKESNNFKQTKKYFSSELYKRVKGEVRKVPILEVQIDKPYVLTDGFGGIYRRNTSLGYFTANDAVVIVRDLGKGQAIVEIVGSTFKVLSEGEFNAPDTWAVSDMQVKGYIPSYKYRELEIAEIVDVLNIIRDIKGRSK